MEPHLMKVPFSPQVPPNSSLLTLSTHYPWYFRFRRGEQKSLQLVPHAGEDP